MNQAKQATSVTDSDIDAAVQDERMVELERRIEQLERRAILNADEEQRLQVVANTAVINSMHGQISMLQQQVGEAIIALAGGGITNDERLGKLKTALQDIARCLINGKVDKAMQTAGELHSHRILSAKAVETMIEVYLRLKE